MDNARLAVSNLNKAFSVPVLKRLSLAVAPGEVHAIVGENGAGKTTLVNILTGNLQKDSGELSLDGVPYEPGKPTDAFAAGVSSAAQELSSIATLSVAENITLRHLPHDRLVIRQDEMHEQARAMLRRVGLDGISTKLPAGKLSTAERQLLELARALAMDCQLLLLDEPTAALAAQQADRVHDVIAEVAASGTSVIYISHRLHDVLRVADTVSVLRDGEVVTTAPARSLTVADLLRHMSGQAQHPSRDVTRPAHEAGPLLEVNGMTTRDLPHAISFACHGGEIVGIAGLAGAGRSELLQALFGLVPTRTGSVRRRTDSGHVVIRSAGSAVKNGLGYLGEERQSMGIFAGQSVLANMMVPGSSLRASKLRLVDRAKELRATGSLIDRLGIRCNSPRQDISQLSGGNQQKAIIARWLHCDADILLLDEPTRGIDVATKGAIYALLSELRNRQKAIVVVCSELEELTEICDRILVLSDRKLVRTFVRGEFLEEDILAAAFQELTDASAGTIDGASGSASEMPS